MDGRFGESHEICYEFVLINLYINSLNFLLFFPLEASRCSSWGKLRARTHANVASCLTEFNSRSILKDLQLKKVW